MGDGGGERRACATTGTAIGPEGVKHARLVLTAFVFVFLGLLGSRAAAATVIVDDGDPIFQEWASESHVKMPRVIRVEHTPGPVPGDAWVQTTYDGVIHWALDAQTTRSYPLARPAFYREVGHVVDFLTFTDKRRVKINRLLRWSSFLWRTDWFAMGYSYCALGAYPVEGWSGYGYAVPAWKQHRLCRFLGQR